MGKYLRARIQDGDGNVLAKLRIKIPNKHRTRLDEWDQPADAYADGVLDGLGQQIEGCR